MAKNINEYKSDERDISLYDIYRILSEECHNSYFHTILDEIELVESGKDTSALTKEQEMYLNILIEKVLKIWQNEGKNN